MWNQCGDTQMSITHNPYNQITELLCQINVSISVLPT